MYLYRDVEGVWHYSEAHRTWWGIPSSGGIEIAARGSMPFEPSAGQCLCVEAVIGGSSQPGLSHHDTGNRSVVGAGRYPLCI